MDRCGDSSMCGPDTEIRPGRFAVYVVHGGEKKKEEKKRR